MRLTFCGDNRRADLNTLTALFEALKADAADQMEKNVAPNPIHKFVLVHGERGLGKTRLILEFFEKIKQLHDPDGYWQPTQALAEDPLYVMPPHRALDYKDALPFLWWGIEIPERPNPGNALFASVGDLLPHLVTMRLSALNSKRKRGLAAEISDVAADIGMDVAGLGVEVAGEAVGLGLIKRIGGAAFRIGSLVKASDSQFENPEEAASSENEGITDRILADLDSLLNPERKTYAGLPAILFVDDAQFADLDDSVAVLLERIIAKSAQGNWPLMIVLTHWSRQLNDYEDRTGNLIQKSAVARVINHAVHDHKYDGGEFANVSGGNLAESNLIRIDLGDPVDDLTSALTTEFPGLSDKKATAIVGKAGGNPRKLEQIALSLLRKRSWFEGHDLTNDLSDGGFQKALDLSDLPIDDIAYDRFLDTPEGVRRSLSLASVIGDHFYVRLLERAFSHAASEDPRTGIEDGETTFSMIRDAVDCSRDDIARFSEPLFRQAAENYRINDAPVDLDGWQSEGALEQALTSLLGDFIRDPGADLEMKDTEKVLMLSLAADHFEKLGDRRAGLALAHLVKAQNALGNFEGANSAAQRFYAGFEPDPV